MPGRLWWCALLGLLWLTGCGHNAASLPMTHDDSIVGSWLDISPYGSDAIQPVDGKALPTHLLTLRADGSYHFEDRAPENAIDGSYGTTGTTLLFTPQHATGAAGFVSGDSVRYVTFDNGLAITQQVQGKDTAYQFKRVATQLPSSLVNEWLLVVRQDVNNNPLPLTESTRLKLAVDSTATRERYNNLTGQYTRQQGTVLISQGSHLALRFPAVAPNPGSLELLGSCALSDNLVVITAVDGIAAIYALREMADDTLMAHWVGVDAVAGSTLDFHSDGTYAWTTGTGSTSGTWLEYYGGYLCLGSPNKLQTCSWIIRGDNTIWYLELGMWNFDDPANPQFVKTLWRKQSAGN